MTYVSKDIELEMNRDVCQQGQTTGNEPWSARSVNYKWTVTCVSKHTEGAVFSHFSRNGVERWLLDEANVSKAKKKEKQEQERKKERKKEKKKKKEKKRTTKQ